MEHKHEPKVFHSVEPKNIEANLATINDFKATLKQLVSDLDHVTSIKALALRYFDMLDVFKTCTTILELDSKSIDYYRRTVQAQVNTLCDKPVTNTSLAQELELFQEYYTKIFNYHIVNLLERRHQLKFHSGTDAFFEINKSVELEQINKLIETLTILVEQPATLKAFEKSWITDNVIADDILHYLNSKEKIELLLCQNPSNVHPVQKTLSPQDIDCLPKMRSERVRLLSSNPSIGATNVPENSDENLLLGQVSQIGMFGDKGDNIPSSMQDFGAQLSSLEWDS